MHEMSVESNHGARVPLEQLYLEHEPRVRWIMHARGVPDAWVDDLVHESFLAVSRRWASRSLDVPTAVWIGGVARNVAFSYRRTEGRRRRGLSAVPDRPADLPPDEAVAAHHAWREVERFAEGLSPKLREVFVLAELGGTPVPEIAAQCGTPVATIHSRLRLARSRFDAHFSAHGEANESRQLLRTAAGEQTPSQNQRRRSLATLLAASRDVGSATSAATVGAGTGASTAVVWGSVAAAVVVSVTAMVVVERALPTVPPRVQPSAVVPSTESPPALASRPPGHADRTSTPPQPTSVVPGVNSPQVASPALDEPHAVPRAANSRRPMPADPTPGRDVDPLAAHLGVLARARTQLQQAQYSQALATLDGVTARADGLERDHQRLLLRAACGAGLPKRIDAAAKALGQAGATMGVDPCRSRKNEHTE